MAISILTQIAAICFVLASAARAFGWIATNDAELAYQSLGGVLGGLLVLMAADAYGRYRRADEERRRASTLWSCEAFRRSVSLTHFRGVMTQKLNYSA